MEAHLWVRFRRGFAPWQTAIGLFVLGFVVGWLNRSELVEWIMETALRTWPRPPFPSGHPPISLFWLYLKLSITSGALLALPQATLSACAVIGRPLPATSRLRLRYFLASYLAMTLAVVLVGRIILPFALTQPLVVDFVLTAPSRVTLGEYGELACTSMVAAALIAEVLATALFIFRRHEANARK